jgi:hypothetical protein
LVADGFPACTPAALLLADGGWPFTLLCPSALPDNDMRDAGRSRASFEGGASPEFIG